MAPDTFDLDPGLQQRLDRLGLDFLADFFAAQVARQPDHVDSLIDLGHVLTRLGRYDDGLRIDRHLVELLPEEPTVHYNLACSLALTGATDSALAALERCIELGYDDPEFLRGDEDLAALHGDPRFDALVERLETR